MVYLTVLFHIFFMAYSPVICVLLLLLWAESFTMQQTFTFSKSTIGTVEKGVKY